MQFLMKTLEKYFDPFFTIFHPSIKLPIVKMISEKNSTNPEILTQFEDTSVNGGRIPTESPIYIPQKIITEDYSKNRINQTFNIST